MQSNEDDRDAGYVWDMLDSARAVQGFIAGVRYEEFLHDRKLQLAIERSAEIMGKARDEFLKNSNKSIQKFHGAALSPSEM